MQKRSFLLYSILAVLLVILIPNMVFAKYPSKRIEMVISFAPGGGTDRVGRAFANFAGPYLGQKVFSTNRTGGSGAIGFSFGSRAKPDGYTITMIVTTLTTAPHTIKDYPVTYKDFTPLALFTVIPGAISVRTESPFKTIQDVIKYAKENPGKLKMNNAGTGSNLHLAGVAFADAAGIEVTFLPYKGSGPSLVAAMGGHVDVAVTSASEVLQHVQGGKMRPLLILGNDRYKYMPDVPLAKEIGYNILVGSFRGVGAPKGLPKDVYNKLLDVCEKVANDPKFIKFLKEFGQDVNLIKGEEFGKWLETTHETYGKAAKSAGLTPQ